MVPRPRRAFLRRAGVLLTLPLAGCSGSDTASHSDPPTDLDESDVITETEILTQFVESDDEQPDAIVRYDEPESNGSETDDSASTRPRLPYVVESAHIDRLQFERELPDPAQVEQFLRETQYDESTVVITEDPVSACHRLKLQYVEIRGSDRLAPQYCEVFRDPSIECSVDDELIQITFIRVPVAYETPPQGSGRGRSSSCELPPDHPARDAEQQDGDDE